MDQNKAEAGMDDGLQADPVFQDEQRHLSETYAKLQRIEVEVGEKL